MNRIFYFFIGIIFLVNSNLFSIEKKNSTISENKEQEHCIKTKKQYLISYHKKNNDISYSPLWLDLLLPSYGLYSLDHKTEGIVYGSLKILTGVGIYFVYQYYSTWNNHYSYYKNQYLAEDTEIQIDNKLYNLRAIQNKADRAFLSLTYLVLLEVFIYSVSFYRTYVHLNKKIEQSKSYYSIYPQVSLSYNNRNYTSINFRWNYSL